MLVRNMSYWRNKNKNIPTGIDGKKRYIYKTCHSKATQGKLPFQALGNNL